MIIPEGSSFMDDSFCSKATFSRFFISLEILDPGTTILDPEIPSIRSLIKDAYNFNSLISSGERVTSFFLIFPKTFSSTEQTFSMSFKLIALAAPLRLWVFL